MEQLPIEVLSKVFNRLDTSDYCHCSSVNKYWYSVFTPLLYSSVRPANTTALCSFTASLSMDVGVFVKELDLKLLDYQYCYNIHPRKHLYLIDILTLCPNIEHLTVPYMYEIINGLIHSTMPVLRLKSLTFSNTNYLDHDGEKSVMLTYHQFRSSLTRLDLTPIKSTICSMDQIITWLESFPLLTDLIIASPHSLRKWTLFNSLFTHCPYLTHVKYGGYSVKNDDSVPYPHLTSLELELDVFNTQLTGYIKRKFTHIARLVIYCNTERPSEINLMDDIMSIKTLKYFHIIFNGYSVPVLTLKEYIDLFFGYPANTINEIEMFQVKVLHHNASMSYDKDTRTRKLMFPMDGDFLESRMTGIGSLFDTMKIHDLIGGRYLLNCALINRLFPRLSQLEMKQMDSVLVKPMTKNHHMKTLKVGKAQAVNAWFRGIEQAYPSLENLEMTLCGKRMKKASRFVRPMRLPHSVISLTLKCSTRVCRHLAILKEVDGCTVKMWGYNYRTKEVTFMENEEAIKPSQKAIIMKSNTIEHVSLILH
ncbi:hypothetical protein BDB01DRAFT_855182 [Pilobolus umbonatus]|nr:hypothetical protein BDB01DRAFT_855182 [Pilobolus umbonatus]